MSESVNGHFYYAHTSMTRGLGRRAHTAFVQPSHPLITWELLVSFPDLILVERLHGYETILYRSRQKNLGTVFPHSRRTKTGKTSVLILPPLIGLSTLKLTSPLHFESASSLLTTPTSMNAGEGGATTQDDAGAVRVQGTLPKESQVQRNGRLSY